MHYCKFKIITYSSASTLPSTLMDNIIPAKFHQKLSTYTTKCFKNTVKVQCTYGKSESSSKALFMHNVRSELSVLVAEDPLLRE